MIDISITRRPSVKHFLRYAMIVSIDGKNYDLNIDFLIWAHIRPKDDIEFVLRPEVQPAAFKGARSPVKKRKAPEGFFCGHYRFIWKPAIEKIRDAIGGISFPLNLISFSHAYNNRLEELKAYATKNNQEIWSAPRWEEITKASLNPLNKVPKEADNFFLDAFKCALKKN